MACDHSAWISDPSSTIGPREVLHQSRSWLHQSKFGSPDQTFVRSLRTTWMVTMSACRNNSFFENQGRSHRLGDFWSHVFAPRNDLHAEGKTYPCDLPADIAKSTTPKSFP